MNTIGNTVENTFDFLKRVGMLILFLLIDISYHPTVVNMSHAAGYESGTILSRYIVILFGSIFILSVWGSSFIKATVFKRYILWLLWTFIVAVFIYAIWHNDSMLIELRSIIIPLIAFCIGWEIKLTKRSFLLIVLVFCLGNIFSGVSQVMTNIGGFKIADQYLVDSKNELGAILASGCLSLFFFSSETRNNFMKYLMLALAIGTLLIIVTIRARAALLAVIILFLLYVTMRQKDAAKMVLSILGVAILLVFVYFLHPSWFDFFNSSLHAGAQEDDFTSGRINTYLDAISFWARHPFLGNVALTGTVGWVHNYPLLQLYRFGLLFSWPILILYFYLFIKLFKSAIKSKNTMFACEGYIVALTPFIISLLEPTFPFGPGTATVYNFIIFGLIERKVNDSVI